MRKVIKDGKVAVLYSPGFGAGWYSWNTEHKQCLFEPEIVAVVEKLETEYDNEDERTKELSYQQRKILSDKLHAKKDEEITALAKKLYTEDFYAGGASSLVIEWIPVGTAFRIDEYDGSESIVTRDNTDWTIA